MTNTTDTARLRELLGAAGQSPEKYAEAVRGVWNAAPALLDELDALRARVAELEADNDELRVALENHNSGSKQLAKWLEESRLEAMDAKRQAASDRARFRMMRVDLATLLEGHRIKGISSLFLDMEEYLQNAGQLDR